MTRQNRPNTPSTSQIVNANSALIAKLKNVTDPLTTCWGCGKYHTQSLARCHIEPFFNGGSSEPENFILLCGRCHREQPDCCSREDQERWLIERENDAYRQMVLTHEVLAKIALDHQGVDTDAWLQKYGSETTLLTQRSVNSASPLNFESNFFTLFRRLAGESIAQCIAQCMAPCMA